MARIEPKLILCLREGYGLGHLRRDIISGITVGIIALPLAMAFGIASIPDTVAAELQAINPALTAPALGIFTAIVAGFLISALGGSRFQIGGPTGAFIVIVYQIASKHGYSGLATATTMAGVILVLMGLAGFGRLIKYVPYPVTTGFTSGIAVVIAATQLKDLFGLRPTDAGGNSISLPPEFIHKLQVLASAWKTWEPSTVAVGVGSLVILIILRRFMPRLPGQIVVVVIAGIVVALFGINTDTIGDRFGGIPRSLPAPHLPAFSPALMRELIPEATTIAILCALESLLSAVVADGMTGRRHRSDTELVGQGIANLATSCFWGIPATGALARTVANIRAGAVSPISGMVHAVTLLLILLVAAPLAKAIPLATLAAVLLMVAWNMSEIDHFRWILRSPRSDIIVLLTTFGLTVLTDLTIAVMVGMVLASFLFMKRMADLSGVGSLGVADNGEDPPPDIPALPPNVEAYEVFGPLFFGSADRVRDTLAGFERPPAVFILRMRRVLCIDATGLHALMELYKKCQRDGINLVLSGVHAQPLVAMTNAGLDKMIGEENLCGSIEDAIARAEKLATA
ncbi:MAG TPA: SulP family inorganic anion transporter [Phycisphaerae bacterium]|nr:SulP family inorganic anion transporter [Phycisphaerae bacterium]